MDIDLSVLGSLEAEKDISLDLAIKAIEDALLVAYHKTDGAAAVARVEVNRSSGHVTVWARRAPDADSREYIDEVAKAYEHFFFRYAGSNLLVVNTSEIDFVNRNEDLQQLLSRLNEPVKGTQYFLPLSRD